MNKICTSIEQFKKLIELGIDINTADMHYSTWTILNEGEYILSPNQGETIEELQEDYGNQVIPAWSLSALFDILPDDTNIIKDKSDTENEKYICTVGVKGDIIPTFGKNPVDACYEMILKLHELKIL